MEKKKYYTKSVAIEENTVYQLDYFLMVRFLEQGNIYGVTVKRTDAAGGQEEECVEGLCERREEAEQFLFRLSEGIVFPVELAALCDDFIFEKEEKKLKLEQVAS